MNWKKERDLLIAQTMAFVQSVTGKTPDLEQTSDTKSWDAKSRDTKPDDANPDIAAPFAQAEQILGAAPIQTIGIEAAEPVLVERSKEIRDIQASIKVPRALASGDVRTEMQARVANFRAHQERFTREREEYFSATLAKARATIGNDSAPDPADRTPPNR